MVSGSDILDGHVLGLHIYNVSLFSAHHVCKLSKMVSLRSLYVAGINYIEKATLEKLRRGESTRNVARDLQVSQS